MREGHRIYTFKSEADKSIHLLEGILKGISYDKKINPLELQELQNWIEIHQEFKNKYPFKDLLEMFDDILKDGIITEDEKEDLLWFCNKVTTDNTYYDLATSDMQRLNGILHGIVADKTIKDEEIIQLKNWLLDNEHLATIYPYDELTALLVGILSDGIITEDERNLLERHILEYVDTEKLTAYSPGEVENIKKNISINGICALDPEIDINGSNFHFTGKSSVAKDKNHFANVVEALGGIYLTGVTKKLNYLIVGAEGSPCWAYACYGRKIEKAIEYRSKGQNLMIVHENDFWDIVEDV